MPYTWPVTLSEAKAQLNITSSANDTELQGFLDAATEIIENIVGAVTTGTTFTDAFVTDPTNPWPYHYGNWPRYSYNETHTLDLRHDPVQAITSVTVSAMDGTNATVLNSSSYRVDTALGTVTVIDGSAFGPLVTVVYTAGRTTVPATIRLAALTLIQHLWQTQRGGQGSGVPAGLDPQDYTSEAPGGVGYSVPNRVLELLDAYRLPPVIA